MAVLALPEDVLSAVLPHDVPTPLPAVLPLPAPPAASITELGALLAASKKPFLIAGGAGWSPETSEALGAFATAWSMPIGLAFRRQDCLNNLHPCYAGAFCTNFTQLLAVFIIYVVSKWASCGRLYQSHPPLQLVEGLFPVFCAENGPRRAGHVGIGPDPGLLAQIAEADLLIVVGARIGEMTSQGASSSFYRGFIRCPQQTLRSEEPRGGGVSGSGSSGGSCDCFPSTFPVLCQLKNCG